MSSLPKPLGQPWFSTHCSLILFGCFRLVSLAWLPAWGEQLFTPFLGLSLSPTRAGLPGY